MKKTPKETPSRRKFLSLGLLGGAALFAPDAHAQGPLAEEGETVKMLTPDGKLVEVSKNVLAKAENRNKASNQDILKWSNTLKSSK